MTEELEPNNIEWSVETKAQITRQHPFVVFLLFLAALCFSGVQSPVIQSSQGSDGGTSAADEGPLFRPPAWQGLPDLSQKRPHCRSQNPSFLYYFLKSPLFFSFPQIFFRIFSGWGLMGLSVGNEAGGDPRSGARHADQGKLSCENPPSMASPQTPKMKIEIVLDFLSWMLWLMLQGGLTKEEDTRLQIAILVPYVNFGLFGGLGSYVGWFMPSLGSSLPPSLD